MNHKPETNVTSDSTHADQATDLIAVQDPSGRRQFFRRGAAYMAAGSAVAAGLATSGNAYADDCDRIASTEKNAEAPNSDSDSGEGADPERCGRMPEKPKLSSLPNSVGDKVRAGVGKIKA